MQVYRTYILVLSMHVHLILCHAMFLTAQSLVIDLISRHLGPTFQALPTPSVSFLHSFRVRLSLQSANKQL